MAITQSFPVPNLAWLCKSLREREVIYRNMAVGQYIDSDVYLQNTDVPNVYRIVRVINRLRPNISPKDWILADIGRLNIDTEQCELYEESYGARTYLFGVVYSDYVNSVKNGYAFRDVDHSQAGRVEVQGNFPIVLDGKNNTITVAPMYIRTKNKEKWSAVNKKIRDVREAFIIRAKLGAFSEKDFLDAFSTYSRVLCNAPIAIIGEYLHSALVEFDACQEATYKFFLALIYQRNQYKTMTRDLRGEFDHAIRLFRTSVYVAAGAVELAEEGAVSVDSSSLVAENQDDSSNQSVVALSSDDVREVQAVGQTGVS